MQSLDGCYPWQPGGCEWTFGFLWRWVSRFGRLDVFVLAFMLVYLISIVIHVCYRCYPARSEKGVDNAARRALVAVLNIQVGNLRSIVVTAPYLGLAGTCIGILDALGGGSMQRDAFRALVATKMAVALVPTAVAMPVSLLATFFHKYLRALVDSLECEVLGERDQRIRHYWGTRRFPPTKQFSELPAFALLTALGLAIAITVCMTFASFRTPTGFYVELASTRCEYDRLIVLHITETGELFLNLEQEKDWNTLASRLSQIYSIRKHRALYFLADSGVRFDNVAKALDTVDKLNIRVQLVTPKVLNAGCPVKPALSGQF